ncbi:StbB family protein [Burkholderia vietnamiensis]|uniref:StbB family protein n=1 Tax=Burkholderia vietnamiensis TaxID=60552 RepID=UPI00159432AA|nr:StbB family protein [Burkholderia vietnamiensis]
MRVAVINFSGNVGKSTLARHLLAPRLNTELIAVETINADEGGENIKASQYDELQGHLLTNEVAVIDIGASNIEAFIHAMTQYRKSHEDFDYFVIPVVKETKQQKDTISTIDALATLGVPSKKIRVIFNKIAVDDDVQDEFSAIFGYANAEKKCIVKPEAAVFENDVFEKSKALNKTISEIIADQTDYRAKLKEAKDDREKDLFVQMILAKRLAESANENLEAVYKVLFK